MGRSAIASVVVCVVMALLVGQSTALRGTKKQRKARGHQKRMFPKYKHQPVGPEEDPFHAEVYPKGLYGDESDYADAVARALDAVQRHDEYNPLNFTLHDWRKYPRGVPMHERTFLTPEEMELEERGDDEFFSDGRGLASANCSAAICQGAVSCAAALRVYSCSQLETLYCPGVCSAESADCDNCNEQTTPEPQDTCSWLGTPYETSCGAETEAECYMTALEHEAAGTAETMNLVLTRRFIDDACENSNTHSSTLSYPHPRIDLENETDPLATCCFVDQVVDPCYFDYGRESYSCPYECTADDVLTQTKKDFINSRLDWVEGYFATLFKSRPLIEPIDVSVERESTRRLGGVTGTPVVYGSDVHLVIVVTAQPSGILSGIAGYAIPLQHQYATNATQEQLGLQSEGNGVAAQRVTVGHFNWCPDTIDEDEVDSNFQQGSSNRLVVHELLHLLNAVKTHSSYHANEWGGRMCPENIFFDSEEVWSGIMTRKVITPRALALGREQFGCDTLPGLPIENQVIGYGSHWETRCFGPEVLAYGENMGESYVSDVTLGFIEDMGFYVANYSAAGRFGDASIVDIEMPDVGFLMASETGASDIDEHTTNVSDFTPGFLRWGRLQGCDFCFGNPKNWPEEYLCSTSKEAGCTPDHRMSARCSLNDWGGYTDNPQAGDPILYVPVGDNSWEGVSPGDIGDVTYQGNIPSIFNYLDDESPSDGITGGYSDANEYAPVMVGYWNCLDEKPPSDVADLLAAPEAVMPVNGSELNADDLAQAAEDAQDTEDKINIVDLFNAAGEELGQVKGQSYGSSARCFKSSLVPLADIVNLDLTFTKNGLCYVANCYSKEYLQVGIRGATGEELLYWYGCPPEGGSMYIPGFSGSILCPVAEDFCFGEDVSGVLYSEIDLTLEWIVWGCAAGVVLIAFIVLLALWKKIDHKIHFCCGINQDQKNWAKVMEQRHGKHSCAAYVLTTFSVLWLIPGLALVGLIVYTFLPDTALLWDTQTRQVPIMATLAAVMVILSCMGIDGSFKPAPSIVLILYFYIVLILCLASIFLCAMPFVLLNVLEQVAATQWVVVKSNFPDSWQGYNSTEALYEIQALFMNNSYIVIASVVYVLLSEVQAVVCSYLNLTAHVVVRNFEMVMNCIFLALGITALCIAIPTLQVLHEYVLITGIVVSSGLILTGCMGVFAACQRHEGWFKAYGVVAFFNTLGLIGGGIYLLVLGGAFSHSEYVESSTFCAYEYPAFDCTCPLGTPEPCPAVTCVNATAAGNCNAEASDAIATRGLDLNTLPMERCTIANFTAEIFTCDTVSEFVSDFQVEGSVSLYLPTLNDTEIEVVAQAYSTSESMDRPTLQAWAETFVNLFGCMLLLLAVFQIVLLICNRLIIKWNHANDFPHGKDPYFLMLHMSAHRTDMRSKMLAMRAFKAAGRGLLGHRGIKVAPESIDTSRRATVEVKVLPDIFGDGVWGLGMSFQETVFGKRKKVQIQGFRVGEDDEGREILSPGLEAGLKIGDTIIQVDGIDMVGGMKEFNHEIKDAQHLGKVKLTIERVLVKGVYVPPKPKVHKNGLYPEITKLVIQRKPNQSLGLNISEVFGSGNEGYGLDKAYLMVNQVVSGSPAEVAGIHVDDTILSVNGTMVFDLPSLIELSKGRNKIEMVVNRMMENAAGGSFRQSNVIDVPVALDPAGMKGLGLGARVIEVTSGLGVDSSVPFLMVCALNTYPNGQPGPSMMAGMKQYDLILMVDGEEVNSLKQLVIALKNKTQPVFTVRRLTFEFGNNSVFTKESKALREVQLSVTRSQGAGLGVALNEAYRQGESDPFVVVTAVRADSAAASAGMMEQDLVMRIDDVDIFSIADVRAAIQGKNSFTVVVHRFGLAPSNAGGITAENFWDLADELFDTIDKASEGSSDDLLSVADMQSFFQSRAGIAQRYIEEMDGYSNGSQTTPDGKISRDEWYGYFDYLAEADTGVAETSPAAYEALRDMSGAIR